MNDNCNADERCPRWGAMGAPPVAESSDLSEWLRSTAEEGALSPTMMSGTATGLTERNIYFAKGKMQTDPDSPPPKIATPMGGLFYWHRYLEGGI